MKTLYEEMIDKKYIRLAINFSLDQIKNEVYYNPVQYDDCKNNIEQYVEKIFRKLKNYKSYKTNLAIRAIKFKNDYAIRNIIILDIDDVIVRAVYCLVLANHIENKLITNCFSSKRGEQITENKSLFEDFATCGWQKFCEWQEESVDKYKFLLKTDISSFFDSISHEYIISSLLKEFGLSINDPEIVLMKKILKVRHVFSNYNKFDEIKHGITIGTFSNHVLANLILNDIDQCMSDSPFISYGRYVDDIRIFSNDHRSIQKALVLLQIKLFNIGLNLNGAKTSFVGDKKLLKKIISSEINHYSEQIEVDDNVVKQYNESVREQIDLPLNRSFQEAFEYSKKKIINDDKKMLEFMHEFNRRLNKEPASIKRKDVVLLLDITSKSYKNEKYAVWLIFCIIIKPRYTIKSREFVLTIVLNKIIKRQLSFYAMSKFFTLMASRQRFVNWAFSDIDDYLGQKQHKRLIKALSVYYSENTIYSKLICEYFIRDFNSNNKHRKIEINDIQGLFCVF